MDTLQLWPLVVALNDCYEPAAAALVVSTIQKLDNETCQAMISLVEVGAELMSWGSVN